MAASSTEHRATPWSKSRLNELKRPAREHAIAKIQEQLVWETYFGGREYDPQFDKVARKFGPFFERVLGDKGGAELIWDNAGLRREG